MAFRKLPRFLSPGNRRNRNQAFSDPGETEDELYDLSRSRTDLREREVEEELNQLRAAAAMRAARSGPRSVYMSEDVLEYRTPRMCCWPTDSSIAVRLS